MIASGKMFLAKALPTSKRAWFWRNLLFHVIDQGRGFVFVNSQPHDWTTMYPSHVTLGLVILGLMGDTITCKYASL